MASWALLRGWLFSAWTTPATWAVDQLVAASDLNTQVRDNLNALKDPPADDDTADRSYSTSSTTFVDVDATNLSLTITPTGDTVLVGFVGVGWWSGSSGTVYVDLLKNGTSVTGNIIGVAGSGGAGTRSSVNFVWRATGLTPGSAVTFKLQFRTTGGTGNLNSFQFWAVEVS